MLKSISWTIHDFDGALKSSNMSKVWGLCAMISGWESQAQTLTAPDNLWPRFGKENNKWFAAKNEQKICKGVLWKI